MKTNLVRCICLAGIFGPLSLPLQSAGSIQTSVSDFQTAHAGNTALPGNLNTASLPGDPVISGRPGSIHPLAVGDCFPDTRSRGMPAVTGLFRERTRGDLKEKQDLIP